MITPAAGFVNAKSAFIIGIIAGIVPYIACAYLKPMLKYDDALDTFGVHAVGGTIGAIVTGVFATADVNGNLTSANSYAAKNGLDKLVANGGLVAEQFKAIAITLALSVVATVVIAFIVKMVIGLRPTEEAETQGLDLAEHGEEAYHG